MESPTTEEPSRRDTHIDHPAAILSEVERMLSDDFTNTNIAPEQYMRDPPRPDRRVQSMQRLERQKSARREQSSLDRQPRKRALNPPIDYRLLDYVGTYDANLMCPICRCPFVDPVMLVECDHYFCRDCIQRTWRLSSNPTYTPLAPRGNCPTCRTRAQLGPCTATSKILVNIVNELVVKCPNHHDGCDRQCKRGEVQDHVNIYCDYALTECPADQCERPVRRKDVSRGCLHYLLSCKACRAELEHWQLESHWRNECPDRTIECENCQCEIMSRTLDNHVRDVCPGRIITCPGQAFGCSYRNRRAQVDAHVADCVLGKLAPIWALQQRRLDEHEAAQKHMSRKVEVLEDGMDKLRHLLTPSSGPRRRRREEQQQRELDQANIAAGRHLASSTSPSPVIDPSSTGVPSIDDASISTSTTTTPMNTWGEALATAPLPRTTTTATTTMDSDDFISSIDDDDMDYLQQHQQQQSANGVGPYASPLHHLLSMHEALRDELARITTTLSELEGRHSMQMLNENLRTRDELAYLGAQVGALQRQVHWMTSAQLQRQQQPLSRTGVGVGSSSSATTANSGDSNSNNGSSAGVESVVGAVNSAATALRGAARMVSGSSGGHGMGTRRGTSEEGRTKL